MPNHSPEPTAVAAAHAAGWRWLGLVRPLKNIMNLRHHLCLAILLAFTPFSHAGDATNDWFAGMLHPPKVTPALPANFIVVSASPATKTTKAFDMSDGVFWAPERTARHFEFGADKKLSNAEDPLFFVHLSDSVGQMPGTDKFTIEKDLVANLTSSGTKKVKSSKSKWGDYPVLSVAGERPDGSPVFVAWVGINSPDGWAMLIDYRVPPQKGHPTVEEKKIWEKFLNETKPQN
jgi:hypothetical protein